MSDTGPQDTTVDFGAIAEAVTNRMEGGDASPPEAAPEAAPETIAPIAETPEVPAEVDAFDDEKVQTFDRDYVTRLREEAARYRTEHREAQERWAEWDKTLDGLEPDQQGLARELVGAILQGDLARAAEIIGPDELAKVLNGTAEAAPVEPSPADAPLTRAEFDQLLAEREQARRDAEAIESVYATARTLGYNPDAKPGDPALAEWATVIQYAQANGGNLEAGHKAYEAAKAAERQRIIDEFVASRSPGSPAPPAPGGPASREPDGAWLEKGGNPLNAAASRAMQRFAGDRTQVG